MRHHHLAVAVLLALPPLAAQNLQLATELTDAARNFVADPFWGSTPLPLGPVTFPLGSSLGILTLERPAVGVLRLTESVIGTAGSAGRRAACHAITHAWMPTPARVPVTIAHTITAGSAGSYAESTQVDLGADGSVEYAQNHPAAPQTLTRSVLVDARSTAIEWSMTTGAAVDGLYLPWVSRLELRFSEPVQEATYGPTCAGELGCQRDAANVFARTLVASFPNDATLAWLFASDTAVNLPVPGVACPLLCTPVLVLAVPLQLGPNGRQFAVLDAVLPPWPGLTWYAQGVAFTSTAGVFVGTNGVILQT